MHEPYADAALRSCPHIAIDHHRPAADHRVDASISTPTGWQADKPSIWQMGIERSFRYEIGTEHVVFFPAPFKRLWTFGYDAGSLAEMS